MTALAPIALFVYNRPHHMAQCIKSLRQNDLAEQSDLYIFSDGPKSSDDIEKVEQVRALLNQMEGFKSIQVIERDRNLGLSNSIITGVAAILKEHERVIALEDDLILSPYFLQYINDGLERYAENQKIASVQGYFFPIKEALLPETFFLRGTDCLGWGTWRRAWLQFDQNGQKLLDTLKKRNECFAFDLDGTVKNTQMLENQIKGKNNSWAIRWHASAFLKSQFSLFPKQSLVDNIGFDNTGTHCGVNNDFRAEIYSKPIKVETIPVIECSEAREAIKKFYRSITPTMTQRVVRKIKNWYRSMLKTSINLLIPPFLRRLYRSNIIAIKKHGGFYGRYDNWQAAQKNAKGYDAEHILEQVANATQQVMNDPELSERDGFIVQNRDYSYPTLAYLSRWAMIENALTVLDIGGSLGSTYYQFRKFYPDIKQMRWMIVEQPHFVRKGRQAFSSQTLTFHSSVEDALSEETVNVVLLSGALQYFSSPAEWLEKIKLAQAKYLIIDRIPVSQHDEDQITIQYVPEHIYHASYPAWIFSKTKFLKSLLNDYSLIYEFPALDGHAYLGLQQIDFRGFILEKI
ncbi:MAG: methyltransferase, TIGR04325 family [Gammaproteobacteria bacterium]